MTYFDDVGSFHGKFGVDNVPPPLFHKQAIRNRMIPAPHMELPRDVLKFRLDFIDEEVDELRLAYDSDDFEKVADALADIVWVVLGLAHMHHLPFDEIWQEVKRSNMERRKALSTDAARHSLDIVKPEGWRPPDIKGILEKYDL